MYLCDSVPSRSAEIRNDGPVTVRLVAASFTGDGSADDLDSQDDL